MLYPNFLNKDLLFQILEGRDGGKTSTGDAPGPIL